MRLMIGILMIVLAGMVILAPTFHATDQPIASLLAQHRQHWPGNTSNLDDCEYFRPYEHVSRYECQLTDLVQYISDSDTILTLRITPDNIRIGDGIQAYGEPDIHIQNRQFHFMRWELPPVTLVARQVRGNWLMGPVDEVYLRG